jgi:hypothetical protein
MRTMAWLARTDDPNAYAVIGLSLTVITLILGAWMIRRSSDATDARLILVLVFLGPIGIVLLNNIGRHDVLVLLGSLMIGTLGRRPAWAIAGALLMVAGNPEQACVASVILLIIGLMRGMEHIRVRAVTSLVIAFGSFIGLSAWAHANGVGGRGGYITEYLGNSIYGFFGNFPLSVFAAFGPIWVVLIWILMRVSVRDRILLVIGLGVIPFAVTAITLDQTRVFVGVSTAALLPVLIHFVPAMRMEAEALGYRNTLFWTFIGATFLPSTEVSAQGYVRVPYRWFFSDALPAIKAAVLT